MEEILENKEGVIDVITLLLTVVIFLVLFYVAKLVIAELGLPANIVRIIYIVMALLAFLWLLSLFGLFEFSANTFNFK